jgi:hypothetical protein
MQIEVDSLPVRTISDTMSRKGSAAMFVAPPLSTRTDSDMSRTTLTDSEPESEAKGLKELMAGFQFSKIPLSAELAALNKDDPAEIALLRARVERLELKFEELRLAVHVCHL